MKVTELPMDRRKAILSLMASIGAAGALSACDGGLFSGGEGTGNAGPFYSERQVELLNRFADTVIPTTDSPGALAAGAPAMMESLMRDWASAERQEEHRQDWTLLDEALTALMGQDPMAGSPDEFTTALAAIDAATFGDGSDTPGVTKEVTDAHRRQKEFLAEVYYLSEIGATQELQYEHTPKELIPCGPLSEIGRTWAA